MRLVLYCYAEQATINYVLLCNYIRHIIAKVFERNQLERNYVSFWEFLFLPQRIRFR